jgi:exodeoxyribonuclease III
MRIATWNVNSINARLETVLRWFREAAPDAAVLQEIKCVDEKFPAEAFESLGYNVAVHGQKTYNGVALLSKHPIDDLRRGLPGDESDEQARYIEALIMAPRPVRLGGLYAPNGNPVGTEKFTYKLAWLERLKAHAETLLKLEEAFVLTGDYNVIPEPADCDDPKAWLEDALFQPQSRSAYRGLKWLGLTDAIAARGASPHAYTFWDYQAMAWPRDHGIRIDHALLSPQAADRLQSAGVERDVRGWDKPSDHVPVVIELAD